MACHQCISVDGDITLAATTADDDPSQYVEDPSLFRDELPQPYRMINKLLESVLDCTWDSIVENRSRALKNASRKRPPQYDCATPLHDVGDVSHLVSCLEDKFVYVATCHGGLVCLTACTNQVLAEWTPEGVPANFVNVAKMCVGKFDENVNLVITVENTGVVKMFLHLKDMIFFAHSFFENQIDTAQKQTVVDVTLSSASNYIGLVMESFPEDVSTSSSCWVDIYRIPKDTWLKELDPVFQLLASPALSSSGDPLSSSLINPIQTPIPIIKFTAPSVVLKIRPPVMPTAINWTSPYQAFKSVDSSLTDRALGTGMFNIVSRHHVHARMMAYESAHQLHASFIHSKAVQEMVPKPSTAFPTLHFLPSAASLCEQADNAAVTAVAVWWSESSNVMHYCLTRTTKDIEVSQADIVWPMSSPVVSSAVTSCGSLFAVALMNNNVVIYDRKTGLIRRVVHIDDSGPVTNMYFHNMSSLCNTTSPPVEMVLFAETIGSGELYMVGCQFQDESPPLAVYCDIENTDEIPVTVKPIAGISDLVIVSRQDGRLFVHDIIEHEQITELILPAGYEYTSWMPRTFATLDSGSTLFVIASCREQALSNTDVNGCADNKESELSLVANTEVDGSTEKGASQQSSSQNVEQIVGGGTEHMQSHVLAYKLIYFPSFDKYFKFCKKRSIESLGSPTKKLTLQDKVNTALQARTCAEADRLERLQRRWFEIKEQFMLSTK